MMVGLILTAGCAGAASGETGEANDEVVGVDDISALESELGMVHDERLPDGTFSRDVKKGGCFRLSQEQPVHWEFRRWKTGAAFFEKTAVSRPIKCVDVDLAPENDPGEEGTISLSRFELESAVRYHLGHVVGPDHAMGSSFLGFDHGFFQTTAPDLFCEAQGSDRCGDSQECFDAVFAECKTSMASDERHQKLSSPTTGTLNAANGSIDGTVLAIVTRFAERAATGAATFDMNTDPVGFFVGTDGPSGIWSQRTRFTRMDVHESHTGARDLIVLTGKNLDEDPEANALIRCERVRGRNDYDCERPGAFLAPF